MNDVCFVGAIVHARIKHEKQFISEQFDKAMPQRKVVRYRVNG